jgi:hypothetical protein
VRPVVAAIGLAILLAACTPRVIVGDGPTSSPSGPDPYQISQPMIDYRAKVILFATVTQGGDAGDKEYQFVRAAYPDCEFGVFAQEGSSAEVAAGLKTAKSVFLREHGQADTTLFATADHPEPKTHDRHVALLLAAACGGLH